MQNQKVVRDETTYFPSVNGFVINSMGPNESPTKRRIPIAEQKTQPGFRKRPRYLTSWEESFRRLHHPQTGNNKDCALPPHSPLNHKSNRFGLVDLFGGNRRPMEKSGTNHPGRKGLQPYGDDTSSNFFTLRVEHRTGGTLAKHAGEERVLLFRSDKAGAIAKIIFSSSKVPNPESLENSCPTSSRQHQQYPNGTPIRIAAIANVHVLFVKDTYRGFHLGRLLLFLCATYLREKHRNRFCPGGRPSPCCYSSIQCRLDAEEDIRRHGKLVHFYELMGLRKWKRAKTTFINNNDGETYRIIPMKMDLLVSPSTNEEAANTIFCKDDHVAGAYSSFLPAFLVSASGETARVGNRSIDSWLIVECQDGNVEFHTTDGRVLKPDEEGRCRLIRIENPFEATSCADGFQLLRVSDVLDKVLLHKEEEQSVLRDTLLPQQQQQQHFASTKEKELWMIRSSRHRTFLKMTVDHDLVLSKQPSFWQADENFNLVYTSDSPGRRQHYRRMWRTQSIAYVSKMRERYSAFDNCTMTIEEALDLSKHLSANPYSMECERNTRTETGEISLPSVRTLLFHTAELARKEGHPDWIQFVALIHGLAGALRCLGSSSSSDPLLSSSIQPQVERDDDDGFDWTIYTDSRVMGCKASETSTFAEFRHLNPDTGDTLKSTTNGIYTEHVGLETVLLSWSSSDYMHSMLQHNNVRLPNEAYAVLKLFPVVDWHTRGKYASLSNETDEELKLFVAEFYELFQQSLEMVSAGKHHELSDGECEQLWKNHYSLIAKKYGAGGVLDW